MRPLRDLRKWLGGDEPKPAERRIEPRYHMEFAVAVTAGGKSLRGKSCDLSQTGIGAFFNADLNIGDKVDLVYALGDGSPAQRRAAIVRNRSGQRYGLEFTSQ